MKVRKFGVAGIVLTLIVFSSQTFQTNPEKNQLLLRLVVDGLNQYHYQPQSVDNEFSENVFNQYIERLDYGKRYFTQGDLEELYKFRTKIDDQIKARKYEFFDASTQIYLKRLKESENLYKELLNKPFDFSIQESYIGETEKLQHPANESERDDRWRKLLKYQVLSRLVEEQEKQDTRLKNDKMVASDALSYEALEEKARKRVLKNYDNRFYSINKQELRDYRGIYLNTIANMFDPHTGYFPPKQKEDFDIRISGRLEGIGARLLDKQGYITVTEIVPGSPSSKQGDLAVKDIILKVGQGDDEAVDIVDMRIDDAVRLIRGKKGTEVRLTVRKVDGSEIVIPIIRDIVENESTFAKSAIIQEESSPYKAGYIHFPQFYTDFNRKNGRGCAEDIAKEIEKLEQENVNGIIIDLRGNGGGSLQEVVDMAGLFIEKGPIVQVKSRNGNPYILADKDSRVQYTGPLTILVNEFSASASEILAAAIQDYKRGVIIGSPSTFGKGTVQRFIDLDDFVPGSHDIKPLGSVKLTTQKYYRINGDATQLKGVKPDIVVPDSYQFLELGESDQDFVMSWDRINSIPYTPWSVYIDNNKLAASSQKRIQESETFALVTENANRLKKQEEEYTYTLHMATYLKEKKEREVLVEKYKNINKEIPNFLARSVAVDIPLIEADTTTSKERTKWLEGIRKDAYIYEGLSVIVDMLEDGYSYKE